MIESPDINWLAILPDLILGLGAAMVLLIDVQWKPHPRVLCQAAGAIIVLAGIGVLIQRVWLLGSVRRSRRLPTSRPLEACWSSTSTASSPICF